VIWMRRSGSASEGVLFGADRGSRCFWEALAALARKSQDEEATELPGPEVSEKAAVEVEGAPWPGLAWEGLGRSQGMNAAEVQCSLTEQGELVMSGSPEEVQAADWSRLSCRS